MDVVRVCIEWNLYFYVRAVCVLATFDDLFGSRLLCFVLGNVNKWGILGARCHFCAQSHTDDWNIYGKST